MGEKRQSSVPDQYWQLQAVGADGGLVDFIRDRVQDLFGDKAQLKEIVFNSQLKFVKGEFSFVGFSLTDGSQLQGEFINI